MDEKEREDLRAPWSRASNDRNNNLVGKWTTSHEPIPWK